MDNIEAGTEWFRKYPVIRATYAGTGFDAFAHLER